MSYLLLATGLMGTVLRHLPTSRRRWLYTPYGHTVQSGHVLFNGQWSEASGFYLLGHGYRGYSVSLMRFMAADTLSPFGEGGVNVYAYCSADPINAADPTGHRLFRTIKAWLRPRGISQAARQSQLDYGTYRRGAAVAMGNEFVVGYVPKTRQLVVHGHGNGSLIGAISSQTSQPENLTAAGLYGLIANDPLAGRWLSESKRMELISCYGAGPITPGRLSFAQEFANQHRNTHWEVKAHEGIVGHISYLPYDAFRKSATRTEVQDIHLPSTLFSQTGLTGTKRYKARYFYPTS